MAAKGKNKAKARKRNSSKTSAFDATIAGAKPKRSREPGPPRAFKDPRMPKIGTVLDSRPVAGKTVRAEVCDGFVKPRSHRPDGERFDSTRYSSLSALMREARGMPSNGWFWFGLGEMRDGELINVREEEG